jgi:opacity protein-like surface antigen
MKGFLSLLFVLGFAVSTAAQAQMIPTGKLPTRPYFGIGLGVVKQSEDMEVSNLIIPDLSGDYGPSVSLTAGWDWRVVAVEIDLDYRRLEFEARDGSLPQPESTVQGEQEQLALMGNVVVLPHLDWGIQPRLGVGLGVGYFRWLPDAASGVKRDADTALTLQAIAGFSYEVTPAVMVGFDYRVLIAESLKFEAGFEQRESLEYPSYNSYQLRLLFRY